MVMVVCWMGCMMCREIYQFQGDKESSINAAGMPRKPVASGQADLLGELRNSVVFPHVRQC